ncbi:MAG TPA: hypothetical protein VMI12_00145 [Puia sp.]|nr:hypothetical protein [Puia sp.]
MEYIIAHRGETHQYTPLLRRDSAITRFFKWAEAQDYDHHVGWVGITVTAMSAVFFPLTMAVILLNGASFGLIVAAMAALVLVVVTNLSALPTKYTIPFFLLGVLVDLTAIVVSFLI